MPAATDIQITANNGATIVQNGAGTVTTLRNRTVLTVTSGVVNAPVVGAQYVIQYYEGANPWNGYGNCQTAGNSPSFDW